MSESGYFYVIQPMPEAAPDRLKLGYSMNITARFKGYRTLCPTARILSIWGCKAEQEKLAIAALTKQDCTPISQEVFVCQDIDGLLLRGDRFFRKLNPSPSVPRKRSRNIPVNVTTPKRNRTTPPGPCFVPVALVHLAKWRNWRGVDPNELAKKAGVARATIYNLENKHTQASVLTVFKLAKALTITRQQLIEEEPPVETTVGQVVA